MVDGIDRRAELPVLVIAHNQTADVTALAVHLITNSAITGATYDIDGGEVLIEI